MAKSAFQADGVVERVLAEFYRRYQIVLAEVVEHTFPVLGEQIASYTGLPARLDIALTKHSWNSSNASIHASWKPIASGAMPALMWDLSIPRLLGVMGKISARL